MSYEQFVEKYGNLMDWVSYYGIINSIPKFWKGVLDGSNMSGENTSSPYAKFLEKKYNTADVYNMFIDNEDRVLENYIRWENILGTIGEYEQYLKLYVNIRSMTLSTKLRSFQYRLLNHGIVTNVQLFKWKIAPSDNCTFCGLEQETIIHLFWDCAATTDIWNKLAVWIKNKANRNIKFSTKNVLFCTAGQKTSDFINTLCLITTQYLYSCRCLKKMPNFSCLKEKIYDIHNTEKYIAISKNKVGKHTKKWNSFM